MSYKPEESTLIDYLYGELSKEEHEKVEAYLRTNKEAREALDALQKTRGLMSQLKDRTPEVPTFTFDRSTNVIVGMTNEKAWWRYSMAVAAGIALIMIAGYLTTFRIETSANGIQLGFGESTKVSNSLTKAEVQSMIAETMALTKQATDAQIDKVRGEFVSQIEAQSGQEVDPGLLNRYLAQLNDQNEKSLDGRIEASEIEQRQYIKQVVEDFAIFLDLQRQKDMHLIQARFETITNDAELNRQQANQILTTLFSTDLEGESNQY